MNSSTSSIQTVTELPQHAISDEKEDSDAIKAELDDQFPEGGAAAWRTVLGAVLVQFCCFGYTMSFGVYQDFYALHYLTKESSSAISWIGGTNAFMATSFSLVAGMLFDRGYFYHLIIGGSILESFTLFMLSLTQPGQYPQIILAQGVGLGIAQGLMYVPTMIVISHYFRRRRTLAMSLVASGSSFGAIIHPIMLNYLFNQGVGFANGVRISAAIISSLLLIACLLMRTRLKPPRHPVKYLSVGKDIIHDAPFCIMCIGLLFFQIPFYYPIFYFQLDSVMHGNSETFSFYSFVFLNGGGLLGRLSAGFIEPYTGVPWLMITATSVCGILILGMIGLNSVPTVIILGSIYGYFGGLYVAMLAPLMALLTSNISELGARMGIGIVIIGIGSLIGGPVSGALLTSKYKWWQSSLSCGLVALFTSSLLVWMQIVLMRRRKRSKEAQEP